MVEPRIDGEDHHGVRAEVGRQDEGEGSRARARTIAEDAGTLAQVSMDELWRANPRLNPLAIEQTVRRERDTVGAALAERGLVLIDNADQGLGPGMDFTIDQLG